MGSTLEVPEPFSPSKTSLKFTWNATKLKNLIKLSMGDMHPDDSYDEIDELEMLEQQYVLHKLPLMQLDDILKPDMDITGLIAEAKDDLMNKGPDFKAPPLTWSRLDL